MVYRLDKPSLGENNKGGRYIIKLSERTISEIRLGWQGSTLAYSIFPISSIFIGGMPAISVNT